MRRAMWFVALVLCVCLPMLSTGCTEEQEATVNKGAEGAGNMATTAAPFLPPPFNLIALAVAGLAEGVTAGVAYRRKKRAVTAEGKASQESEMKDSLTGAVQAFGDMLDALREDKEHPEYKEKIEETLALIDSYKRQADGVTTEAFAIFDAARKRMAA